MDIIKELRLRRWARENYVAPEKRSDRWDAVILNEMAVMDQDIADQKQNLDLMSEYAPLMAKPGVDEIRKVHQPHPELSEPKYLNHSGIEQPEIFFG